MVRAIRGDWIGPWRRFPVPSICVDWSPTLDASHEFSPRRQYDFLLDIPGRAANIISSPGDRDNGLWGFDGYP